MKRRRKARDGLLPANRMLPSVVPTCREVLRAPHARGPRIPTEDALFYGLTARPAAWSYRCPRGPSARVRLSPGSAQVRGTRRRRVGSFRHRRTRTHQRGHLPGLEHAGDVLQEYGIFGLVRQRRDRVHDVLRAWGTGVAPRSSSADARAARPARQPRPDLERHAHAFRQKGLHRGGGVHSACCFNVARGRRTLGEREPRHHGAARGARKASGAWAATDRGGRRGSDCPRQAANAAQNVKGTGAGTSRATTRCETSPERWDRVWQGQAHRHSI